MILLTGLYDFSLLIHYSNIGINTIIWSFEPDRQIYIRTTPLSTFMVGVNCENVLCSLLTRNAILQIIRNFTTAVTKLVHGLMKIPRCVVDIGYIR